MGNQGNQDHLVKPVSHEHATAKGYTAKMFLVKLESQDYCFARRSKWIIKVF